MSDTDWHAHLLERPEQAYALLARAKRIAVLGIKVKASGEVAWSVPAYAQQAGFEVVPVPVYYPDVTEILGEPVYRRLVDIPGEIDMVNVFRRPKHIPSHVDDILATRPRSVWFQLGIRDDEAAELFARAGIDVVQDRCLMTDLAAMGR